MFDYSLISDKLKIRLNLYQTFWRQTPFLIVFLIRFMQRSAQWLDWRASIKFCSNIANKIVVTLPNAASEGLKGIGTRRLHLLVCYGFLILLIYLARVFISPLNLIPSVSSDTESLIDVAMYRIFFFFLNESYFFYY